MPYELRIASRRVSVWPTPEEAELAATQALRASPDCEPEVFDTETGRPVAPASSRASRDELANRIGY